jgi:hypothetical protein
LNFESQFILKKRIFKNPLAPVTDPVEHNLLYCQVVDNVNRDVYVINERDAIQLATLRACVLLGENHEKDRFMVEGKL